MAKQPPPCSMVLEGGVTSAVIYASLLSSLAPRYTFQQLGGASSGAVAACAAAAAEFARLHGAAPPNAAFALLGEFPQQLATLDGAGRTALFRLFQPAPAARRAFRVAMAALDPRDKSHAATAGRILAALIVQFWVAAALVALPVALTTWITAGWLSGQMTCGLALDCQLLRFGLWVLLLLPGLLGALLALALWALWTTCRALRGNHWGLCNGMEQDGAPAGSALTTQLHAFYQTLAGRPPSGPPLTFGDLWWGPAATTGPPRTDSGPRQIDLQVITTAVSQARPVRLPGEPGTDPLREYFYDPLEWKWLFPPAIMAHLASHARPVTLRHDDGRELRALPAPKDWPVLMAARFSLSFPILLSALPMYIAIPRRDMLRAGAGANRPLFEARKVYFSDGGITSNCPIHLFDAPLPGFPTFGANLYTRSRGNDIRVSRSDTRDPELDASATRDGAAGSTPLPFLRSIVSTMLGWRDSLQRRLPGYRERVVHIGIPEDAGGLHLAMPPSTILMLAQQGIAAANALSNDFSMPRRSGEANAWERHRWTRTRTTLSALHSYLDALVERLPLGSPDYPRLLRTARPADHPFADERARQQALDLAEGIRALMAAIDATRPADAMDQNAPQPRPELHMSPPW